MSSTICGCSWNDVFPSRPLSIPNADAVDRALRVSSLTAGEQPYHLSLSIAAPADAAIPLKGMSAEVEVYWLNAITYRTVVRSRDFSQTRIVNGPVVEEHDTGDFYPRWIENFVDAILDPAPKAAQLRKVAGNVPVGIEEHACITADEADTAGAGEPAQICFQNAEPRIASGSDNRRSVWFDDFSPFGRQQIARTLVDKLPGGLLLHGRVTVLEPLRSSDYSLLKAYEFTPPDKLIQTETVPEARAMAMLNRAPSNSGQAALLQDGKLSVSLPAGSAQGLPEIPTLVEIRTDRTGKVREAYPDNSAGDAAREAIIDRALALRFKPLMAGGVPRQMEAAVSIP